MDSDCGHTCIYKTHAHDLAYFASQCLNAKYDEQPSMPPGISRGIKGCTICNVLRIEHFLYLNVKYDLFAYIVYIFDNCI